MFLGNLGQTLVLDTALQIKDVFGRRPEPDPFYGAAPPLVFTEYKGTGWGGPPGDQTSILHRTGKPRVSFAGREGGAYRHYTVAQYRTPTKLREIVHKPILQEQIGVPGAIIEETEAFEGFGAKTTVEPGVEVWSNYRAKPLEYEDGALVLDTTIYQSARAQDEFGTPVARSAGLNVLKMASGEAIAIKRMDNMERELKKLEEQEIPAVQRKGNAAIDRLNQIVRRLEGLTGQKIGTTEYIKLGVRGALLVMKFTPLAPIAVALNMILKVMKLFGFDPLGMGMSKSQIDEAERLIMMARREQAEVQKWVGMLNGLINKRNALFLHYDSLVVAFESGPKAIKTKIDTTPYVEEETVKVLMDPRDPRDLSYISKVKKVAGSGMVPGQQLLYMKGEDQPIMIKRAAPKKVSEVKPILSKKKPIYGGILGACPKCPKDRWEQASGPSSYLYT